MITVLLADDHAAVRKGLKYLLESTPDMQVVATAAKGVEAVAYTNHHCPDVAVIDVSMPGMDGIEASRHILVNCPLTRIMILSGLDDPETIRSALDAGAFGYVLKDMVDKDFLAAIRTLYKGRKYFSLQVAKIAEKYMHQKDDDSWAV